MPLATPGAAHAHPDDPLSADPSDAVPSGDGVPAGTAATADVVFASDAVDRHHVTRIDIEPSDRFPKRHPTHGWQVRARRAGKRLSKFFADSRWGSPEAALAAAVEYRDRLLAELPETDAAPRKAWSNTGVVGLSIREKDEGLKPKLYVQLNWIDAGGRRRASSYSVEKWGFRRALWNGCLRLFREREAAGSPVEEPHVMFARAQEPFQDLLRAELDADRAREAAETTEAKAEQPKAAPVASPVVAPAAEPTVAPAAPRAPRPAPSFKPGDEDETVRYLESVLFG